MSTATAHAANFSRMGWFLKVWGCLLVLTAGEVFLAYEQLELHLMLALLMGLSLIKAGLIIAYFMHLRYERRSLFLTLIPALVFVLAMMAVLLPDSLRMQHMRLM
ncbi:MAG: cytochrome C oxidase subunit IV family protein [Candidatus Acidiferrales bacterium]|jgi:cytochrome c oxidase subunit 4